MISNNELIENFSDVVEEVNSQRALISDEYDSTKIYQVGDLCIYNNKLCKCIEAVVVGETFNSTKWEETMINSNLTNIVTVVKEAVYSANANTTINASYTKTTYKDANGTVISSSDIEISDYIYVGMTSFNTDNNNVLIKSVSSGNIQLRNVSTATASGTAYAYFKILKIK